MVTFQFENEYVSAQELFDLLKREHLTEEIEVRVVRPEKEGLSGLNDFLEFIFNPERLADKVYGAVISMIVKRCVDAVKDYPFAKPHVVVKFSDRPEKKIMWSIGADKFSEELIACMDTEKVVKTTFKAFND